MLVLRHRSLLELLSELLFTLYCRVEVLVLSTQDSIVCVLLGQANADL